MQYQQTRATHAHIRDTGGSVRGELAAVCPGTAMATRARETPLQHMPKTQANMRTSKGKHTYTPVTSQGAVVQLGWRHRVRT